MINVTYENTVGIYQMWRKTPSSKTSVRPEHNVLGRGYKPPILLSLF